MNKDEQRRTNFNNELKKNEHDNSEQATNTKAKET